MLAQITPNSFEALGLPDADVSLLRQLPFAQTNENLLDLLLNETPWHHQDIIIHDRAIKQPRLTAWYGDSGAVYTYSGLRNEPLQWTPLMLKIKAAVEQATGQTFNSALLNLYRDNQDSIGFHSDNEAELGPRPTIASLSIGHRRTFILRHKSDRSIATRKVELPSGSLLIMAGDTQSNWVHGIQKEKIECGPRINITFRTVHPD